jgi:DNA polymerase III subunit delta
MNRRTVYLLLGNDEFALQTAARELVQSLVPASQQAFGLEIIEGEAEDGGAAAVVRQCLEALQTSGFLGDGKVVWLRNAVFLAEPKRGAGAEDRLRVKDLVALIERGGGGSNTLLITLPELDKRSALYRACAEKGDVREYALPDKAYLIERQAREKIQAALREAGIRSTADVTDPLLEIVGTDSRQIANEIDKLCVYLGGRKDVTPEDLRTLASASRGALVWDLLDAVGERRLPDALVALRRLFNHRENPMGMIVALSNRVRDLLLYREFIDAGWLKLESGYGGRGSVAWQTVPPDVERFLTEDLKKDPRQTSPFYAGRLASQASRYSAAELRRLQGLMLQTQEQMVTSPVPTDTVLELLLFRILRRV